MWFKIGSSYVEIETIILIVAVLLFISTVVYANIMDKIRSKRNKKMLKELDDLSKE